MRAVVRTMLIRDREGYEVRNFGQPKEGGTLASLSPSGVHIVGKSGENEKTYVSTPQDLRLWQKGRKLQTADETAVFMSRWGQLSRWIGDDGDQPYQESFMLIEPHLEGLRYLASYVESGDKTDFCLTLKNQLLLSRANIIIDVNDPDFPLILEAPSLLRFMLLEMWSEFGGERSGQWGIRNCRYCTRVFHVGGRYEESASRCSILLGEL